MENIMILGFLVLFVLGGGASLWGAVLMWQKTMQFRRGPVKSTNATITNVYATQNRGRTTYIFHYYYSITNGDRTETFEDGVQNWFQPVVEGGTIRIEYLQDNPSVSRMLGSEQIYLSLFAVGTGIVCFFFAGLIAVRLPDILV